MTMSTAGLVRALMIFTGWQDRAPVVLIATVAVAVFKLYTTENLRTKWEGTELTSWRQLMYQSCT